MRVTVCLLALAGMASASPDAVNRAQELYQHTQYQNSLTVLGQDPSPDVGTYLLTGKTYFMMSESKKAHQAFEKAVALDPHNNEAKNDLFDYYLNAPGVLGGGIEKAEALSRGIAGDRPVEHEFEEAQIAEKRNDLTKAEAHFRKAMELAPHDAGRIMDLARFLAKHGRFTESDELFARAHKAQPNKPDVNF